MSTMRILVGLPASGKSSYAKTFTDSYTYGKRSKWASVNWDNLRWFDKYGNPKDYKFSRQNEDEIKKKSVEIAKDYVDYGFNLIIDNTNLSQATRDFWSNLAATWQMKVEIINFDTPLDECLRRNALRTGWQKVPRAVIERMALFNDRIDWSLIYLGFGQTVLVDIDGTLADGTHRQKYVRYEDYESACGRGTNEKFKKDWKTYFSLLHLDTPIIPVVEWVRSLYDQGYYICIVSGRDTTQGDRTVEWLSKHNVMYHRLFMRNGGDSREDSIIKKEILDKITPNIRVAFAIDDRPRVIRMWRENGIKVYDVGKGIEF